MRHRIFALFILLFALAARLYGIDAIRQEQDFARPHGEGIVILESISAGKFNQLPVLSLVSGINLPNPPGVAYFWAFVALFDRSPYSALVIVALLSVLGIAMLYDLGRRLFGPTCGSVAALLATSSSWAIYDMHGTWIQAFLEFACITSAWMVIIAIQRNSGRRMLIGLLLTAVFMQTYLLAMALLMQVGMTCGYALRASRKLAKSMIIGLIVCSLSACVFLVSLYVSNPNFIADLRAGVNNSPVKIESIPNPFGIHLDLAGLNHSLRIVSGNGYENALTDTHSPDFAVRNQTNHTRAIIVELLVALGTLVALLRLRRDIYCAILLTWFGLPVVLTTVALILAPNLFPEQWYLLITAPTGYLLAGIPFGLFDRVEIVRRPRFNRAVQATLVPLSLVAMIIPGWNLVAHAQTVYDLPVRDNFMESLAEGYQLKLGALWRKECLRIDSPQTVLWVVSVYGTSHNVQPEASRVVDASDVWQVAPEGGNCVTRLPNEPAPLNADLFPISLSNGTTLLTYRSRPVLIPADFKPLDVNLGWQLMDLQTTPSARPGEMVTVTHIWRIGQLPQEAFAAWYYTPFVSLLAPDGQRILMVDKAPSVLGYIWHPGDYIVSTIRFQVPANSAAGNYLLQMSLFDPNQKKNAVYFDPSEPGKPIVVLERDLRVP